jgi:hypothetical protein
MQAQGRHRYCSLENERVAAALESLFLAGAQPKPFVPNTPPRLRRARTCYDHMAGEFAVTLHDCLLRRKWIARPAVDDTNYEVTALGSRELAGHGIDVAPLFALRRRIACACLNWSERRPHMGSAAAQMASKRRRQQGITGHEARRTRVSQPLWSESAANCQRATVIDGVQ